VGQVIGIANLGWYAFRHTYRTLLDDLGTPVGVQQKLMRHSDIRTTMNVYGSAYEQSKRQANERVAGKLLEAIEQPAPKQLIH
jgi:integrase